MFIKEMEVKEIERESTEEIGLEEKKNEGWNKGFDKEINIKNWIEAKERIGGLEK